MLAVVIRTQPRFFCEQQRKALFFQIILSDNISSLVPGLTHEYLVRFFFFGPTEYLNLNLSSSLYSYISLTSCETPDPTNNNRPYDLRLNVLCIIRIYMRMNRFCSCWCFAKQTARDNCPCARRNVGSCGALLLHVSLTLKN